MEALSGVRDPSEWIKEADALRDWNIDQARRELSLASVYLDRPVLAKLHRELSDRHARTASVLNWFILTYESQKRVPKERP